MCYYSWGCKESDTSEQLTHIKDHILEGKSGSRVDISM